MSTLFVTNTIEKCLDLIQDHEIPIQGESTDCFFSHPLAEICPLQARLQRLLDPSFADGEDEFQSNLVAEVCEIHYEVTTHEEVKEILRARRPTLMRILCDIYTGIQTSPMREDLNETRITAVLEYIGNMIRYLRKLR